MLASTAPPSLSTPCTGKGKRGNKEEEEMWGAGKETTELKHWRVGGAEEGTPLGIGAEFGMLPYASEWLGLPLPTILRGFITIRMDNWGIWGVGESASESV